MEEMLAAGQGKNNWKAPWPWGTLGHTAQAVDMALLLCQQAKQSVMNLCAIFLTALEAMQLYGQIGTDSGYTEGGQGIPVGFISFMLVLP